MKIKTSMCKDYDLWHGFKKEKGQHWYDLGLIAVDFHCVHPGKKDVWIDIYFLWWNIEVWR